MPAPARLTTASTPTSAAGVEPAGRRVPPDLAGARRRRGRRRTASWPSAARRGKQRRADQSVGTSDGDAHVGEGTRRRGPLPGPTPSVTAMPSVGSAASRQHGGTSVSNGGTWQPPDRSAAPPPPTAVAGRGRRSRPPVTADRSPTSSRSSRPGGHGARSSPPRSVRWPSSAPASSPITPVHRRQRVRRRGVAGGGRPGASRRDRERGRARASIDVLLPGRARDAARPATELVEELQRLEVLSDDASLSDIGGVDVDRRGRVGRGRPRRTSTTSSTSTITAAVSGSIDGEALPIGDWIRDNLDQRPVRAGHRESGPAETDTLPDDGGPRGRSVVPQRLLHGRRVDPRRDRRRTSPPRASPRPAATPRRTRWMPSSTASSDLDLERRHRRRSTPTSSRPCSATPRCSSTRPRPTLDEADDVTIDLRPRRTTCRGSGDTRSVTVVAA